jgi:hypothetical protein
MKKMFRKPLILLFVVLFFQWGMFLWTTCRPYMRNIPDRTYLITRYHPSYTSFIRQAKEGAWGVVVTQRTRPSPVVYSHLFFVFLGKIAAIGNIDPPIMFMASRMASAIVLFLATYWLITLVLPLSLHALAILFTLALEPGPMITSLGWNPAAWIPSIFSYFPQVVSYRHFGLPHHTMGEAVGLFLLGTCILCVKKPTRTRLILLGILGVVDAIILPPYPAILILTVLIPWGIYSLFKKQWKRLIVPFLIIAATVGAIALFTRHEIQKGIPWRDFNIDEKSWVTDADAVLSYVSTLMLSIPFVAFLWFFIWKLWKKWDKNIRFLVIICTSWVIVPVLLVPLSSFPWFPFANFRVMDGYNYVPTGILATLGFSVIPIIIKKGAIARFMQGFLLTGVIILSLSLTYLYTAKTFGDQNDLWTNVYVHNDHWEAMKFLETVPKGSGVMVMNHFGEIIPDYTSVRTFIGSTPGFTDWPELFTIAARFYSGQMADEEVQKMFRDEDISYVYYSEEERRYNVTGTLYPNLLTSVFETPVVTVYKVNSR